MSRRFIELKLVTLIGLICLLGNQARADFWMFTVTMDGTQEVPPNASPGTGTATAFFDDISGAMSISGSFAGLTANANNAHLHGYAPAGSNAGIVFGLSFTAATSGTISGNGVIPADRIADVLNGLTYINIHSSTFPGGEIRGQLTNPIRIPEPSCAALLVSLVATAALRRRV